MKHVIRVGVLCAAVAALALGSVAGAGAGGGIPEQGEVIVTPPVSEVGGTVTIANAADAESTCQEFDDDEVLVEVFVYKPDNKDLEQYFEPAVDEDGNWSIEFEVPNIDAAIGEWEVDAFCGWAAVEEETSVAALPEFYYNIAEFEVIGADVPDSGTAPAEEVRTAPRFTG